LGSFKPQELSNIVWVYANAEVQHNESFKDECLLEIVANKKKRVHIVNVVRQVAKRLAKTVSTMHCHGEEISTTICWLSLTSNITFVCGRNSEISSFGDSNDGHPISKRAIKQQQEINMTLGYTIGSRRILKEIRTVETERKSSNIFLS
jgi:hypothetical protein